MLDLAAANTEVLVPGARAQLTRFDWACPEQLKLTPEHCYHLELSLTPRPAGLSACYSNHWPEYRQEPLGELILVPPGETLRLSCPHLMSQQSEPMSGLSTYCYLSKTLVDQWAENPIHWSSSQLQASLNIVDRSLRHLMLRLTRELMYPGHASEALIGLVASEIAIELGRFCSADELIPLTGGLASWRLRMIDERIAEPGKAPTLAELSELCKLSVRQLSRGFRVSRGVSVGSYVEARRFDLAKQLLAEGAPVIAVAQQLGYASQSSFSHAFRRLTGVSPARFRKISHRAL